MIVLAPVVLLAGAGNPPCTLDRAVADRVSGRVGRVDRDRVRAAVGRRSRATAITATGLNLTAGQPAYEIAVDPTVIPLGSFAHVTPNPFGTRHAFYAGDTGGAIIGHHVDIYDWQGRAAQDAWGKRHVTVTPAPNPGTGNLLGEITPTAAATAACQRDGQRRRGAARPLEGRCRSRPGRPRRSCRAGWRPRPQDAPRAVKLAIAAGNQLIDKPYIYGGGHGQPLTELAAGYDCSGSTSFVLHGAGVFGDYAEDSTELESYGQAGPGQWITVYANSAHAFIDVAGIVLDTAWYAPVQPTSPGSGPRWQPASIIAAQYAGDQADGNGGFVQRHPAGL